MSLDCVQFLSTFISGESSFIKLFEATREEREVVTNVICLLNAPQKAAENPSPTPALSSPKVRASQEEPEDVVENKIVEIHNLALTMKELIGIIKSG